MSINKEFYEGALSLTMMAVACTLEKTGHAAVHISREDLATICDRMHVACSNGVHTGMFISVRPKTSAPEAEVPAETSTTPEPEQELYDADPNCKHQTVDAPGGGIKCTRCAGWFCF